MKKLKKIPAACAVCALQYVSGIDEETVLRVCALHGFEVGKGMEDAEWMAAAGDLKVKIRGIALAPRLLRQFLKDYPAGLFLVGTHDHLFAVDNGIIVDPRNKKPPGLKRIIRQAWRVESSSLASGQ